MGPTKKNARSFRYLQVLGRIYSNDYRSRPLIRRAGATDAGSVHEVNGMGPSEKNLRKKLLSRVSKPVLDTRLLAILGVFGHKVDSSKQWELLV